MGVSSVFKKLAGDKRIIDVVELLLGDKPFLFKDKIIFKLPGTGGYELHQDYNQFQPFSTEIISALVAIDSADGENGGVELFPGFNHKFYRGNGKMKNNQWQWREALNSAVDISKGVLVELKPGDVIYFHCLTPHRSGHNSSNRPRRMFYPTYSAAGDQYSAHYNHVRKLRNKI